MFNPQSTIVSPLPGTLHEPPSPYPPKAPPRMVNRLKSLVSKKKIRFQADGFDLDLSYISPRIIAMGFPAERLEGLYRNHIEEVSRFFEQRHKGHYKIYHLCNERDFDACRFSGPVVRFPFSDHNAPQLNQIVALSQDVSQFLCLHPDNVVAINCKAGKGRTGVMVSACLMEMHVAKDASEALQIYADRRTRDGQGVTIPSQRRYVGYYSDLINSGRLYKPTPLRFVGVRLDSLHALLHGIQGFEVTLAVYQQTRMGCTCSLKSPSDADANCAQSCPLRSSPKHDLPDPSNLHTSPLNPVPLLDGSSLSPPVSVIESICRCCGQLVSLSPTAVSYPFSCSTSLLDGSFHVQLDDPVKLAGDFRVKIKAKLGVLTKKIGQCWLNTYFIARTSPHCLSRDSSLPSLSSVSSMTSSKTSQSLLKVDLSQSDMDDAFKCKGKKPNGEEFQVSLLFTPYLPSSPELLAALPSSLTPRLSCSGEHPFSVSRTPLNDGDFPSSGDSDQISNIFPGSNDCLDLPPPENSFLLSKTN